MGDFHASPSSYFPSEFGDKLDLIHDLHRHDHYDSIIVGGGGLLEPGLAKRVETLSQSNKRFKALWGVGANTHGKDYREFPSWLINFDLVGLRDWGNPFDYVPCVSCLHPGFDLVYPDPVNDFVVFEHFQHPIAVNINGPVMSNDLTRSDIFGALARLASGKVVITNTYHGAYWSQLLGRKVVLFNPFSSRFFGFKHQPPHCDDGNWEPHVEKAFVVEGFLEECRDLNRAFHAKVTEGLAK